MLGVWIDLQLTDFFYFNFKQLIFIGIRNNFLNFLWQLF